MCAGWSPWPARAGCLWLAALLRALLERAARRTFDSLLTITLREAPGGGTALTLVHERLDVLAAAMPDVAKNVGPGWELVLEKLIATIGIQPS